MKSSAMRIGGMLALAGGTLASSVPALAAGALAIDSNHGERYGYARDFATVPQAERHALQECGISCRVVLKFYSGCGAFAADQASGSDIHGWGTRPTARSAKELALSECRSQGGTDCKVRVWACDSD